MTFRALLCAALLVACPARAFAGALERAGESGRAERSRRPSRARSERPSRTPRVDRARVAETVIRAIAATAEHARDERPSRSGSTNGAATAPTQTPAPAEAQSRRERQLLRATRVKLGHPARRDRSAWEDPPVIELGLDAGMYDQGVQGASLEVVAGRSYGMGLHARHSVLLEPYAEETRAAGLGSYHLAFLPRGRGHFRSLLGFGLRTWRDDVGTLFGFDAVVGMDFRFARHGMGHLVSQLGTMGHAFVLDARATLGYHRRRYEVFGGYSHLLFVQRGSTAKDTVSLGGALAGVRLFHQVADGRRRRH